LKTRITIPSMMAIIAGTTTAHGLGGAAGLKVVPPSGAGSPGFSSDGAPAFHGFGGGASHGFGGSGGFHGFGGGRYLPSGGQGHGR
jgi:hypothetical protein